MSAELGALAHWDLGTVDETEPVLQGSVNRVYRIQATGGITYLRCYRTADPAVLEREAVVMSAARAAFRFRWPCRPGAGPPG